jgi:dTDP-3-amino-3,4,6-trideoxy-alpha-D-glucose transaminase
MHMTHAPSDRRLSVPLMRMDNADPALAEELLAAVERVARSGAFILSEEVDGFEAEFAAYCATREAVALSSGTDALALALRALEIGPGDEVIVPANSFIATAEAVTLVGATPRFVDVDPETAVVTVDDIRPAIGPRTRCIIPVHLYGRTVDLDPIMEVARAAGLSVVEDACQAHGALLQGRRAGSIGDCGCFSFYPAKNLGAWGDGGGLVTNDPDLADRVRLLRSHGERPRYHHLVPGTTARLDAVQAAVLRVKLPRLDARNARRRRAAERLTELLAGSDVQAPADNAPGLDHVYHQYVVGAPHRDALRDHLATRGIASAIHYPVPIHRSPAYASSPPLALPTTEALARTACSLPMHPDISDAELEQVAAAVHEFVVTASAA